MEEEEEEEEEEKIVSLIKKMETKTGTKIDTMKILKKEFVKNKRMI